MITFDGEVSTYKCSCNAIISIESLLGSTFVLATFVYTTYMAH